MFNIKAKAAPDAALGAVTVFRGVLIAYLITIPAFLVFALILCYLDFPQKLISPAVIVTTIVSVIAAAALSSKDIKSKGWLNGGIVGLAYMVVLYFLSSIVYKNFTIDKCVINMAAIGILTGSAGGMIGINVKDSGRHRISML